MLIICLIIASQTFLSKFLLTSFYALCLEAHIFGSCSYCNEKGVVSWCFRVMLSLTHAHTPFLLTKWGNEWNFLQHASTVLTFFFKEQFWCHIWEGEGIFCWDGAEPSALLVIIFAPFFLIVFFTFSPPRFFPAASFLCLVNHGSQRSRDTCGPEHTKLRLPVEGLLPSQWLACEPEVSPSAGLCSWDLLGSHHRLLERSKGELGSIF